MFPIQLDDVYSSDRIAQTAADKSEIAALKVKIEGLHSQVREEALTQTTVLWGLSEIKLCNFRFENCKCRLTFARRRSES